MPKIHLLEDHLLGFMQRFRGLLEYSEDFVEVYHQFKKPNALTTATMRSRVTSALYGAEVEVVMNQDEVKTADKDFVDNKQRINHPNNLHTRQDVKAERRNSVFERAWEKYDDDLVPIGEWLL